MNTWLEQYYKAVIRYRLWVILLSVLTLVVAGVGLGQLEKDTSAKAFFAPDDPALLYRDKVAEQFGLRDPIVLAVMHPDGVFNPHSLQLVAWLNARLEALPNVDPERVLSLATAKNVLGTFDGMQVSEFLDPMPETAAQAQAVAQAVADFPLYHGSLVSRDQSMTLLVAELLDEAQAQSTYEAIQQLVSEAPVAGETLWIAGEGAVAGYLSSYVDRDAQRLNPLAGVVICLILLVGFVSWRAVWLPNLIILATVVFTLGVMALSGSAFYVITNGLIVCMIGIAVADSIHIFSQYYQELADDPSARQETLVVRAMCAMSRPISLSCITTMAGFLALYPTSDMPPIKAFGLFGALAVWVAWLYTVTLLPAVLSLLKPKQSPVFARARLALSQRVLIKMGQGVLNAPRAVVLIFTVLAGVSLVGVSQVVVEDQRIANFKTTEPLYQADQAINRRTDGTYHLDIVLSAKEDEGLHDPQVLTKVAALQWFLEQQPHVNSTSSYVDYLKQMHRAVHENDPAQYRIPDDQELVAQLFLLYASASDPTDFADKLDSAHRTALVRANLDIDTYANNRQLVPAVEAYLAEHFNDDRLSAHVTGRVHVNYRWLDGIAQSHISSIVLSLVAVGLMSALLFRSLVAGVLTLVPVVVAILVIYAVMGYGAIYLGISTSMFAAIAIGLGVDFSIHTLERLRELAHAQRAPLKKAFLTFYQTTGRALFYNLAAVALGFGVLISSDVPPLIRFGVLVALAVCSAFVASLTLLPALIVWLKPRAIVGGDTRSEYSVAPVLALFLALLVGADFAHAMPEGAALMQQVANRAEGERLTRSMSMELIDKRGHTRRQEIKAFRLYVGADKRTLLFYTAPSNVRGTGFLTFNYHEAHREDDQWLYLPALRKVRRIPASNRGDYFLGTDFSYEEIKSENKVGLSDYHFTTLSQELIGDARCWWVEGTPVSESIGKELGVSKAHWCVDESIGLSRKSRYWDIAGNPLKEIDNLTIELIDGIWTVTKVRAHNLKTGHTTVLTSTSVDYQGEVSESLFDQRTLIRGL